jgi:hypothetical protein
MRLSAQLRDVNEIPFRPGAQPGVRAAARGAQVDPSQCVSAVGGRKMKFVSSAELLRFAAR